MKENNLLIRSVSGAVLVFFITGSILWNFYAFALLFYFFQIVCLNEFYRLSEAGGIAPHKIPGFAISTLLFFITVFLPDMNMNDHWILLLVLFGFFALVFIRELYRSEKNPFINIPVTFAGIIYITIPFSVFILASNDCDYVSSISQFNCDYTPHIPLSFFILLWTNDTFAYLGGILYGKRKLFPSISPNKTWEGTITGSLATIVASCFIASWLTEKSLTDWVIAALIIIVLATFGDLTESMFKRFVKVKNSGSIMPGHGGLLDRFDGLLLAAPVYWLYFAITNS